MPHQLDLFLSKPRRVSGGAVTNSDWIADGLVLAERFLPYGEVMGEDFKRLPGIARPSDPSLWGQLVRCAIRARIIHPTGRYQPSEARANHAHRYRVYQRGTV